MKRTLISFIMAFTLLTGCSSAAAPQAAPSAPPETVPAPTVLSASTQSKLTVILTDCGNSIAVNEAEVTSLSFSGPSSRFHYTVSGPVDDLTTVCITQTKDDFSSRYTLSVPKGAYHTIRVELKDSAASLSPRDADYEIFGRDNALSATISPTYAGKLSGGLEDSAVSLTVSGQNPNISLDLGLDDCAVDAPKSWNYKWGAPLNFTRGTGGADIDLRLKDCAVSVEEGSLNYFSRYEGKSNSTSMSFFSKELQLLMGDVYLGDSKSGSALDAAKAASKPNGLVDIKTISTDGITALQVNADLCAVVLEPSMSGAFELAYQGVESGKRIAVSTEVKGGALTVTAEGTPSDQLYLNASPDWRVNCVRLLVPEGILQALAVDCGTGIIATNGLTLPAVTGGTVRGMVSLNTKTVSAPIAMSSGSGGLSVTAGTVSAPVSLQTKNGGGEITANTVTADVTLSARNGSVEADVGTATGKLTLTAKNGSVAADVETVTDAIFQAQNGSVEVTLGSITGDTGCTVTNGSMEVELRHRPTDLTFHLSGDWKANRRDDRGDDWRKKEDAPSGLPDGWYDGLVLGSGRPSLTLSATSNGDLSFQIP